MRFELPKSRANPEDEMKPVTYRHTQRGTLILVTSVLVGVLGVVPLWQMGEWPPAVAFAVITLAVASLFSSLTVEISDGELRWYFGPGLWTYRVPLDAIKEVAVVRYRWWYGWGIRMATGFRLYNVSGLDAVELKLGPNDTRRVGTDDPQGLALALRSGRA